MGHMNGPASHIGEWRSASFTRYRAADYAFGRLIDRFGVDAASCCATNRLDAHGPERTEPTECPQCASTDLGVFTADVEDAADLVECHDCKWVAALTATGSAHLTAYPTECECAAVMAPADRALVNGLHSPECPMHDPNGVDVGPHTLCDACGVAYVNHPAGDGIGECAGDFGETLTYPCDGCGRTVHVHTDSDAARALPVCEDCAS